MIATRTLRERLIAAREEQSTAALVGEDLELVIDALDGAAAPERQELLYIQASTTHPGSGALGMLMIRGGRCEEPPADFSQWWYHSVLDAVSDGWRIISFPNISLLRDPVVPQGLGCEFILERWR